MGGAYAVRTSAQAGRMIGCVTVCATLGRALRGRWPCQLNRVESHQSLESLVSLSNH